MKKLIFLIFFIFISQNLFGYSFVIEMIKGKVTYSYNDQIIIVNSKQVLQPSSQVTSYIDSWFIVCRKDLDVCYKFLDNTVISVDEKGNLYLLYGRYSMVIRVNKFYSKENT